MIYITELRQWCPLMSEAEHDYLSLNQAFSFIIFILLFLEKTLKNAPVKTQMGAILILSPLNGGGVQCAPPSILWNKEVLSPVLTTLSQHREPSRGNSIVLLEKV